MSVASSGERPLKILQVVEAFSTGVFEVVRQIANATSADGHEIHVAHAMRPWTPTDFEALFDPRVQFHRLAWDVRRRPGTLILGTLQLARLLRSRRWDLAHLHSTFAGVAGATVRPRRLSTVYTPHGYAFLMDSIPPKTRALARTLERFVARRITVLGAVSEAEASEAKDLGAREVRIIHNGIAELDGLARAPTVELPAAGARRGVVAAGRMSAQRQPLEVAKIFGALPPGTPTAWLGDAADPVAADVMERGGTELTGWLARDEVLARTRAARVYLHWTAWDGHPLSVLEAISQGTVVVAHDIPPVREILGPQQLRRTVGDAAGLIRELLESDVRFADLQRAQAQAAQRFSGQAMTASWISLYTQLVTDPWR